MNKSIDFFDAQFRDQVSAGELALNPFETIALPHLRGRVLDFGCGTGSYLLSAFSIIGETGKYIAIDSNQEAVDNIKKLAETNGIKQIECVRSSLLTGLKKRSVDIVLLYDVFHMVENQTGLLAELSRVLKETGELSFSDHHMKKDEILKLVTSTAFFAFKKLGKKTFTFVKRSQEV